jgi:non-specific serine/threonine protein kinase
MHVPGHQELLGCTPEPRLYAGSEASAGVCEAFAAGDASGMLYLATVALKETLVPELAWARDWGRLFLTQLCQRRDPGAVAAPSADALLHALQAVPPMPGAEYVSEALLVRLWEELREAVSVAAATHEAGLAGWLQQRSPLWHLVGRVTFHLAENKRNETHPFAFMATYTEQLTAGGRLQHTPLGRALQQYAAQKNQPLLDALLLPVREASKRSALVSGLLESRRLFQALAWTPTEAFAFLREIPAFEESGLVVKLPDWWKRKGPSRPVVTVTLDAAKAGGVGLDAMLSFKVEASLDGARLTPEEWAQIQASPSGLVNLRGQWVELDADQLGRVMEHWKEVEAAYRSGGLSFHEGMRLLAGFSAGRGGDASLPDLDAGREWSQIVAGKGLEEVLRQLREPEEAAEAPGLLAVLRPYQSRGLGWLHFLTELGFGACLADDMGLGKTLQLIALLCLRKARQAGPKRPSILVVPASLLGNWLREFERFAPHLRIFCGHASVAGKERLEVLVRGPVEALAGYDALLTSYGLLQRTGTLQEVDWDVAVLDEAQAIKNPATAQARSVKKLKARARVALTGTPVENRMGDLWSLFDFLNPGLLGKASDFAQVLRSLAARPGGYAAVRKLIQPYLLRRLKTDRRIISDLPDKTEVQALCALTKKQGLLYAKLVEQLKSDLSNENLPPNQRRGLVLGYLIKFKQVCNHPSHWSGDGRFDPEDSGKFLRLTEIAAELAERQERCLVFTQFREMTDPLSQHLERVFGRPGLVLHGDTPVRQRAGLVERFQQPDGPPFFVLSVKAGGTGLTLTAANHVIHFDRWWNPAVENQATDRAFRIGQKRNVLVHKFLCPGTIEEKVDRLIAGKAALAEDLLGGEGGAEKLLTDMSNEELLECVRLDIQSALL